MILHIICSTLVSSSTANFGNSSDPGEHVQYVPRIPHRLGVGQVVSQDNEQNEVLVCACMFCFLLSCVCVYIYFYIYIYIHLDCIGIKHTCNVCLVVGLGKGRY